MSDSEESDLIRELRADIERLRQTVKKLNWRATKAEGQVSTTIEDCRRQGVSLGRGLANAGYELARADLAAAVDRAVVAERELDAAMLRNIELRRERDELWAVVERVEALADEWHTVSESLLTSDRAECLGDAAGDIYRTLSVRTQAEVEA